jgi:hypothetical protein
MFKLEIATDNAAFEDADTGDMNVEEIVYILHQASYDVQTHSTGELLDSNGNRVGWFELS